MKRQALLIIAAILAFTLPAAAQTVYTPERDSAERKAILAALRVPVEKDFKQKIVFVIDTFNSNGSWAYISGAPKAPGGGDPSLSGTKFAEYEDAYDGNFFGLLRKSGGRWRVVTYAIGCTDVCWLDWSETHRAPRSIFPRTSDDD
jgi:hypothetical protein